MKIILSFLFLFFLLLNLCFCQRDILDKIKSNELGKTLVDLITLKLKQNSPYEVKEELSLLINNYENNLKTEKTKLENLVLNETAECEQEFSTFEEKIQYFTKSKEEFDIKNNEIKEKIKTLQSLENIQTDREQLLSSLKDYSPKETMEGYINNTIESIKEAESIIYSFQTSLDAGKFDFNEVEEKLSKMTLPHGIKIILNHIKKIFEKLNNSDHLSKAHKLKPILSKIVKFLKFSADLYEVERNKILLNLEKHKHFLALQIPDILKEKESLNKELSPLKKSVQQIREKEERFDKQIMLLAQVKELRSEECNESLNSMNTKIKLWKTDEETIKIVKEYIEGGLSIMKEEIKANPGSVLLQQEEIEEGLLDED
jgi:hypothetical protein